MINTEQEFIAAMDDDLNTADAISAIFELVTAINTAVKDGASRRIRPEEPGYADGAGYGSGPSPAGR